MCAIRSHLPHRSHSNFLRRTSWICTRPSPWALRVYVLRSLRSRAFIHGSRPQQWTSWQHIWPTVNPPQTRKQGTTANALATTPPLPSWGARPLLPLTTASLPQEPTTQLDLHPISLMLTSLNFRNWRMMFSSTVIHLNARSTRFLSNSASLGKTVFATGHGRHPNQNLIHHPFYSCPTAIADACNICALSLLQILSTANFSYFRTSVKIIGNLSLDRFSRCHCTHELLRMK